MYQNYPNPFNPSTHINFSLPKISYVEIVVYDAIGVKITELVNQELRPGSYSVDWKGSNFPSGVNFYRIRTENFTTTRKMVLIK
jgi:hypothetical protein